MQKIYIGPNGSLSVDPLKGSQAASVIFAGALDDKTKVFIVSTDGRKVLAVTLGYFRKMADVGDLWQQNPKAVPQ